MSAPLGAEHYFAPHSLHWKAKLQAEIEDSNNGNNMHGNRKGWRDMGAWIEEWEGISGWGI